MLDRAIRTTPSANIVASLDTMRLSVAKRRVSRPSQVDNSPTTRLTPTTKIVRNVCDEALDELNDGLEPDQYLQIRRCMNFDSGASNHMTSHEDWFYELQKPERPNYVENGDDTIHPI